MLKIDQPAPDFHTRDIWGNRVQLIDLRGNKILLTFNRHVGCPITNLRFLELSKYDHIFQDKGLVALAVYDSSETNLLRYSHGQDFYTRLIANPGFDLYEQYKIEQNVLKILFSMYKGVYHKSEEGKRHFRQRFDPEGHPHLLGAEFLIGEDGFLRKVYYNQYLGDHLPVAEILAFIGNSSQEIR